MTATIQSIDHTPGSGLATLICLDESGDIVRLHADAGPLFRAFSAARVNPSGTRIAYTLTDFSTIDTLEVL